MSDPDLGPGQLEAEGAEPLSEGCEVTLVLLPFNIQLLLETSELDD